MRTGECLILICVILGDDYNRIFDSARIIFPRCDNELSEAKEKSHNKNRRTPVLTCIILENDYNRFPLKQEVKNGR